MSERDRAIHEQRERALLELTRWLWKELVAERLHAYGDEKIPAPTFGAKTMKAAARCCQLALGDALEAAVGEPLSERLPELEAFLRSEFSQARVTLGEQENG